MDKREVVGGGHKPTWGDVFRRWLQKGYDHAYAAWMADKWERRETASQRKAPKDTYETQ